MVLLLLSRHFRIIMLMEEFLIYIYLWKVLRNSFMENNIYTLFMGDMVKLWKYTNYSEVMWEVGLLTYLSIPADMML